jgi:MoaA/NifB/PqqE/SkfB family radical SAM enzyme
VVAAFQNLRAAGVPFGVSMTATRDNVDRLLQDDVLDFCFDEMGAIYAWIFQYMPIGRKHTLNLMVTPEQRLAMYRRTMDLLANRGLFIADFWNTGELSSGCISAGRPNGYAYIDWHGNVLPCVFVPYFSDNINDIFARGGNINDIVRSDFFASVRKWQDEYGFNTSGKNLNNWIAPCPYRDHHELIRKAVEQYRAKPADENAAEALQDPEYYKGMVEYGARFRKLTDEIWTKEYLEDTSIDLHKLPLGRRKQPPRASIN